MSSPVRTALSIALVLAALVAVTGLARQRLSLGGVGWLGFAGTLLLAAALSRRAETNPRGGTSRHRVEGAVSGTEFTAGLAPVFTSGDMTSSGNQP